MHPGIILTLLIRLEVTISKILSLRNTPSVAAFTGVEDIPMQSLNKCPHVGQHFSHCCYGNFPWGQKTKYEAFASGGTLCSIMILEMEHVITLYPDGSTHFLDECLQMNGPCIKDIYTFIIISHSFQSPFIPTLPHINY